MLEERKIMVKCEICGRKFKSFIGLSVHIKLAHSVRSKDYYDKYMKTCEEGICPVCGEKTFFKGLGTGYCVYCSYKCSNNSKKVKNKKKQTCLNNYGVVNPSQSEKIQGKKIQTCLKNHDAENPFQLKETKKKIIQTNLKIYGRAHRKQTHIRNYDRWYDTVFIKKQFLTKDNVLLINKMNDFFNITSSTCRRHLDNLNIKYKKRATIVPEELAVWELYCRLVKQETDRWGKEVWKMWDGYDYYTDEKLVTNEEYRKSYPHKSLNSNPLQPTLDHKISKLEGFVDQIQPEAIGDIINLCICSRSKNSSKGWLGYGKM
ncbi:MAG: hypothetical protein U9Q97_08640 [Acidobacteriota bacterium]|nr:hypothetical protein [Acidobacteriota bacterium]